MKRRGFSLLELLMVIALIALLIALLLPSIRIFREKANRVKCLAHLSQIGVSLTSYAVERDGELPPHQASKDSLELGVYAVRGRGNWWKNLPAIERYRGNGALVRLNYIEARMLYCPSWTYPYIQFGTENPPGFPGGPIWTLDKLPGHQRWMQTSYAFRGAYGMLNGTGPRSPSLKRDSGRAAIVADHFSDPRRGIQYHHKNGYNVLHLDGSVRFVPDPDLVIQHYNGGFTYHAGRSNYRKQEQVWERYLSGNNQPPY